MSEKKLIGTKCTEKDVLMGRGKRVSEWPGNIFFRQCVANHRDTYNTVERSRKIFVANTVLEEVKAIGGRFLKEESDGSWTEIELHRAVEKTCQALREKEKANPPAGSPFDGMRDGGPGPVKRKWLKPGDRKKASQKKRRRDDYDETSSDEDGSTTETESDDEEETETESESETEPAPKNKKKPPKVADWNHADMMRQLNAFIKLYGHGAIPPILKDNSKLSDWAIVQRQLYRERQNDYRGSVVREEEKKRLDSLDALGFVWDYDGWHWEQKYNELVKWHDEVARLEANGTKPETTAGPRQDIVDWLQEQQRQYKEATWNVPTHRVEKLRKVGVTLE